MSVERRPSKGRLVFQGLPINIEIEAGEKKVGYDDRGQAWSHTYDFPYGEIERTKGEDGDPVDVYLGPDDGAERVYVVHQLNRDRSPDEDKVMLGFASAAAAEDAYRRHGPDWGFGTMDEMSLDAFKTGYLAANRLPAHRLYDSAADREQTGHARYGTK